MEVSAKARYVRMSPRKVRLVIDVVRGMPVSQAVAQLTFMKKAAALPVLKLVKSASANAQHNFNIDPNTLYIKTIAADGGPVLHRWRARAFGRAAPIRKRMSHVSVTLATREGAAAKPAATATKKAKPAATKKPAGKKVKATT